jgi:hypothetical protein
MPYLRRRGGFLCEEGYIREHAVEVELLLVAGSPDGRFSLSADRQNRSVVQFGVVQACDQVGSAGTARRQTDPNLTGKFGVGDRHESRHLFVADLDEVDLLGPLQRSDYAVDAVARISVYSPDSPGVQAFNNEIADFHCKLRWLERRIRNG